MEPEVYSSKIFKNVCNSDVPNLQDNTTKFMVKLVLSVGRYHF